MLVIEQTRALARDARARSRVLQQSRGTTGWRACAILLQKWRMLESVCGADCCQEGTHMACGHELHDMCNPVQAAEMAYVRESVRRGLLSGRYPHGMRACVAWHVQSRHILNERVKAAENLSGSPAPCVLC